MCLKNRNVPDGFAGPICNSKTQTKVCADTVMFKFPLFCKKCKSETKIDVMQFKIAVSK